MRTSGAVEFLLDRLRAGGGLQSGGGRYSDRWWGMSSDSIVMLAFGRAEANPSWPIDASDLASCYRCVLRMPYGLVSNQVLMHLGECEKRIQISKTQILEARKAAGWDWRKA